LAANDFSQLSIGDFLISLNENQPILAKANCPEINVTEAVPKRDPVFQSQPHCPLNSVTEQASLKSLGSQGGDLVEGSSKWDYIRVMSERYQRACRKEKHLILDELVKNLKVHRKSAVRALNSVKKKKALPRWLRHYDAPEVTKHLLIKMSKSTIDFYLRPYKAQYRRHWNSGTRSGKYIKTMIPLKPLDCNVTSIGHVEADTVHHCGGNLSGVYALTL
jgi:hypothetical protein